jgi:hypothetical protein
MPRNRLPDPLFRKLSSRCDRIHHSHLRFLDLILERSCCPNHNTEAVTVVPLFCYLRSAFQSDPDTRKEFLAVQYHRTPSFPIASVVHKTTSGSKWGSCGTTCDWFRRLNAVCYRAMPSAFFSHRLGAGFLYGRHNRSSRAIVPGCRTTPRSPRARSRGWRPA